MDLKLVFFQSVFFGCRSRAGLHPEMGINFRCIGVQKWRLDLGRDGFPQVVGGIPDVVMKPKTTVQRASICQASGRCTAACCAALPTRARVRHHHEPMGSACDGVDYESLASVLTVAIAAFSKPDQNWSGRGRGQSPSGRI